MGTALATVPWSVGSANVVPGDGRADSVGGTLYDLRDLATWSGVCGVAEQQQGLPTGAFITRGRHLEPLTQFVQRQTGDDLYRLYFFSLTQNRMMQPYYFPWLCCLNSNASKLWDPDGTAKCQVEG